MANPSGPTQVVRAGCTKAVNAFLEYDTPKIVHITSKKVGVINRIVQLIIIIYIVGYVIVWNKGYQDTEIVSSATTTKVKGVAWTNYTELNITAPGGVDFRVWDVADYVIPPQENGAFFVMTNVVFTPNQTQGTCPEDPQYGAICKNESDCTRGVPTNNGNGIQSGKCVQSAQNTSINVCEIYAWCPVEVDRLPVKNATLLKGTQEFTVLIKNNIEFPKFHKKRRNILDSQNKTYLSNCKYNSSDDRDRLCPIFQLGQIVKAAGVENFDTIAVQGGVVSINIDWNCDLDHSIDRCLPTYSFTRLDDDDAKIAKGTNFRYANFYDNGGIASRDLFKSYGILFIVKVTGVAGKFSVVPTLVNIGSGIGLLAIATVICDLIVLYVMDKRNYYFENKYQYVGEKEKTDEDDDDNHVLRGDNADDDDALLDPGNRVR